MSFSGNSRLISREHEVDIVDLAKEFWNQKLIVLIIVVLFGVIASAYAFIAKPVYKSQVYLLPPSLSDIAGFNTGRKEADLQEFSVASVYDVFGKTLQSEDGFRAFFKNIYAPALGLTVQEGASSAEYEKFRKEFTVRREDLGAYSRFVLAVESGSPEKSAEWATLFVNEASEKSKREMLEDVRQEIGMMEADLQRRIRVLQMNASVKRSDRIIQLKEALAVAEAIGLDKPPVFSGQSGEQVTAIMEGRLTYMRGAKALRAELGALQGRQSDDPFEPSLRDLQQRLEYFRGIEVDPGHVSVFRQDGVSEIPVSPVRPKKLLIIVLGLIAGAILASVVVVSRFILKNRTAQR